MGWLSMQLFTDTGILNVLICVTKRVKFDFCLAHIFQLNVICEFLVFYWNIMELWLFFSNNRPDLVDFSKLNKASPDQNLEYSFHVAEKELGVPRLLDVEGKINH